MLTHRDVHLIHNSFDPCRKELVIQVDDKRGYGNRPLGLGSPVPTRCRARAESRGKGEEEEEGGEREEE